MMLYYGIWSAVSPFISTFALAFIFCFLFLHFWNKRAANSPPGTNGWPLLGVVPLLTAYPERVMQKWAKKYGPLYMVKFGTIDVVVISSPEVANEAFAKNDCFNDRPKTMPSLDKNGIFLADFNEFFKEQRRFCLNTLREFGMGRRNLEPKLLQISGELCGKIDSFSVTSEPFSVHPLLFETLSSVISCMIFGFDVAKENDNFRALVNELTKSIPTNALNGVLFFAPFLRHFPVFSRVWARAEMFRSNMHREIEKEVLEHQKSRDPNEPRDFIDYFLNEMDKAPSTFTEGELSKRHDIREKTRDDDFPADWRPLSSFNTKQLVGMIRDVFIAGSETTASAIWWIILYMCKYPDVQRKMQQEIDDVLGQSGVPRMSIMEKLPYVRAVIQEITRIRPTVPLAVPHIASRDASLLGYRIPKGAIILTNIWAIHHDETRWPEPDKFSPERHLDEDGKFIKSSNWMMFNVGGRACLGQQLAKMQLFFSIVTLFRRYHFSLAPGEDPDMNGESQITLHPYHFKAVVTKLE